MPIDPVAETTPRWLYENPDTGTEMSVGHPVRSGECEDAWNIRRATVANLADTLRCAWEDWAEARDERDRLREENARMKEVLEALDRRGGLGLDAHDRIGKALGREAA